MLTLLDFRLYTGDIPLVRAEYLEMAAGAKHLLVAPNGSGKTLLLHALAGEYRAWDGDITLRSEPLIGRKTILLDNSLHLLPDETVWHNLIIPLPRVTERLKGRLVELTTAAGITDQLKRKAVYLSYSGGKFVEVIRAVVQLPHLILIDNIDHAFDEANLQRALSICSHAAAAGTTMLATATRPLTGFDAFWRLRDGFLESADA